MADKTRNFWATDWFTGVIFTLVFLLAVYQLARGLFYDIETSADKQVRYVTAEPSFGSDNCNGRALWIPIYLFVNFSQCRV